MSLKDMGRIRTKTLLVFMAAQAALLLVCAARSLGHSASPNYQYPIDSYLRIFRMPFGYLFPAHILPALVANWLLYALIAERIVAWVQRRRK